MSTAVILIGCLMCCLVTANPLTETEEAVPDAPEAIPAPMKAFKIDKEEKELVDIVRALDKASKDLTAEERDMLDDLLDDDEVQCDDNENSVSRQKRGTCNRSCSVTCKDDQSCSISNCCRRAVCRCTWFGKRPKCNCR